jgi:hypothetical protein
MVQKNARHGWVWLALVAAVFVPACVVDTGSESDEEQVVETPELETLDPTSGTTGGGIPVPACWLQNGQLIEIAKADPSGDVCWITYRKSNCTPTEAGGCDCDLTYVRQRGHCD